MNTISKQIILGLFLSMWSLLGMAQQDAMYTHYMFNTQTINPAYVGSREAFSMAALHRSQWASHFDGNPVTQTLTMHSPPNNENVGLGLSFYNDQLGPEKTTSLFADFAYRVRLSEESTLSFGLKGGVSMHSVDYAELSPNQGADPILYGSRESAWLPNFGFGLYYARERFYAGISVPQLLQENFFDNSVDGGAKFAMQRHYYLIGGAYFHLTEDVDFKPTSYLKVTKGAPIELDLTANFIFYDRFLLGVMYRTRDAIGAMAGLMITDQLSLGYSYDWSVMNRIPSNNFGSHEIVLRYDFIFLDTHKLGGLRYF